jgi:uncharacterized iron-regulated membrane protein
VNNTTHTPNNAPVTQHEGFYRAVWRWHFHAGLFVIPFLLTLSISGLLMLLSKPAEHYLQRDLSTVQASGEPRPASALHAAVRKQFPDATVQLYLPGHAATQAARFSLVDGDHGGHGGHDAASTTVYVDPYSGEVLGTLDAAQSWYARFKAFHGSLLLGDLGDALLETAAGLGMLITGLYLACNGNPRPSDTVQPVARRNRWRRLHRLIGFGVALPLLFFLASGLAWTNLWGGKLVQAWNSVPGTRFEPQAEQSHESMNQHGVHRVPWAVEQTPMPLGSGAAPALDLDAVVRVARQRGFDHYRVHLPQGAHGVWTISATTIAGDITNPWRERTVHLDPASGRVLATLAFADYPALGMAMAASIPLHQGDLGLWNWCLNLLLVLLVIALIGSGVTMWWQRRPSSGRFSLTPPTARPFDYWLVWCVMLAIALCFPLSAAALLLAMLLTGLWRVTAGRWRAR